MKSQIKEIVIGIFAVIGFTAIVMGFNNPAEPQQVTYATPESHVWEMHMSSSDGATKVFSINRQTGEVRKYDNESFILEKDGTYEGFGRNKYLTMIEAKAVPKN